MNTPYNFEIQFAFVSRVPPLKNMDDSIDKVTSRILDKNNSAYKYFIDIFDCAINNCKIQINFKTVV